MKTCIKAIIVEDDEGSTDLYISDINAFNTKSVEYFIEVVGISKTYIETRELIKKNQELALVFLDINLDGEIQKSGLDIFLEYRSLSYIIVSSNEKVWQRIFSESEKHPHDFVVKAFNGFFEEGRLVKAIEKFVEEKRSSLFRSILFINNVKIDLEKVALITSQEQKVFCERGSELLVYSESSIKQGEYHYFNYPICVNQVVQNNIYIHSLRNEMFSKLPPVYSLKNIIKSQQINPSQFIQIAKGTILNLNYVQSYDRKGCSYFDILVTDFLDSKTQKLIVKYYRIKCSRSDYITDEVISHINAYIDNRVSIHRK